MSDLNAIADLKALLTLYVEKQTPTEPPPFDDIDVRAAQGSVGK
jgi:hypothetical protein